LGKHWRGSLVDVCAGGRCVQVRLSDWCQCYDGTIRERVIDLSDDAFAQLAPLSRGVLVVTVRG
jgi:rare lipoprotein A (peptidoglycan hydrolase)